MAGLTHLHARFYQSLMRFTAAILLVSLWSGLYPHSAAAQDVDVAKEVLTSLAMHFAWPTTDISQTTSFNNSKETRLNYTQSYPTRQNYTVSLIETNEPNGGVIWIEQMAQALRTDNPDAQINALDFHGLPAYFVQWIFESVFTEVHFFWGVEEWAFHIVVSGDNVGSLDTINPNVLADTLYHLAQEYGLIIAQETPVGESPTPLFTQPPSGFPLETPTPLLSSSPHASPTDMPPPTPIATATTTRRTALSILNCIVNKNGGWDATAPLSIDIQVKKLGQPFQANIGVSLSGELGQLTDIYHVREKKFIPSSGSYLDFQAVTDSQGVTHIPVRIRYLEAKQKIERGKPILGQITVYDLSRQNTGDLQPPSLGSCGIAIDYVAFAWSKSGRVYSRDPQGKTRMEVNPGTLFYQGSLLELGDFDSYQHYDWNHPAMSTFNRQQASVAFTYLDGTVYGIRFIPQPYGVPTLLYSFGAPKGIYGAEQFRGYWISWTWEKAQDKGADLIIQKLSPEVASSRFSIEIAKLTFHSPPKDGTSFENPIHNMPTMQQELTDQVFEAIYRKYFLSNWEKPSLIAAIPTVISVNSVIELSTRNNMLRIRTFEGSPNILTGLGNLLTLSEGQEILVHADGSPSAITNFDVPKTEKWWLTSFTNPGIPKADFPISETKASRFLLPLPTFLIGFLLLTLGGAMGTFVIVQGLTAKMTGNTSEAANDRNETGSINSTSCAVYALALLALIVVTTCLFIGGLFFITGGKGPFG